MSDPVTIGLLAASLASGIAATQVDDPTARTILGLTSLGTGLGAAAPGAITALGAFGAQGAAAPAAAGQAAAATGAATGAAAPATATALTTPQKLLLGSQLAQTGLLGGQFLREALQPPPPPPAPGIAPFRPTATAFAPTASLFAADLQRRRLRDLLG